MCIFGKRLKELRRSASLTVAELSVKLNEVIQEDGKHIAPSTITMYETGHRIPSMYILNAITDFFGVDANYMLGQDEMSPPSDEHRKSALIVKREKTKKARKETLSATIDKDVLDNIRAIAETQERTVSSIVEGLLEKYIEDYYEDQDLQDLADKGY